MCLCVGDVLVENRYRLGLAPAHWIPKPQVRKNKTAPAIVHSRGTHEGKYIYCTSYKPPLLSLSLYMDTSFFLKIPRAHQ